MNKKEAQSTQAYTQPHRETHSNTKKKYQRKGQVRKNKMSNIWEKAPNSSLTI